MKVFNPWTFTLPIFKNGRFHPLNQIFSFARKISVLCLQISKLQIFESQKLQVPLSTFWNLFFEVQKLFCLKKIELQLCHFELCIFNFNPSTELSVFARKIFTLCVEISKLKILTLKNGTFKFYFHLFGLCPEVCKFQSSQSIFQFFQKNLYYASCELQLCSFKNKKFKLLLWLFKLLIVKFEM